MSKKTIALDIDKTLFYTSKTIFDGSIELSNGYYAIYRPWLQELFNYLHSNQEHFDVVVYSAATWEYIMLLLSLIDDKNIIKDVYDRKFCEVLTNNGKESYYKNAKLLKLENLYLIDDNEYHFRNYEILGYNCKSFKPTNNEDCEIFEIINFLETLKLI